MERRRFTQALAGAALGSVALGSESLLGGEVAADLSRRLPRLAVGAADAPAIPFKLSVMLWTVFRNLPFEERLEKVAEAGYKAVELVGEFKKWSEDDWRSAMRKKRELGMAFDTTAGLGHGVGDPSARDALLADVRGMLPVMDRLECPALIVMSGNKVPGTPPEVQHASCVEGLKRAAEIVEQNGVTLLLENIDLEENPKYYLWSVAEGLKIIQEVNHPHVKFLYDFFHAQISEGNLIAKLDKHIDLVGLLHVADVPARHEPGTGEINYENIFKKLARLNYSGYAAMEFLPSGDAVESLRAAREMAQRAAR